MTILLTPQADPAGLEGIALPEKDLPILSAAIAGEATHLLTGDQRHFGPYFGKVVRCVRILRPAQYLARGRQT